MGLELNEVLKVAIRGGASDIHLKSGLPPMFRVDGALVPLKNGDRILPEELQALALSIMNPSQKARFDEDREADLAYGIPGLGRFRVNVFQQRGSIGAVFRVIPFGVKTVDQLLLPKVVEAIAAENRGLVLVTGTTGSGKSTTLAAMIEQINQTRTCHIMTIEDPIEFLIRDRRSIVMMWQVRVWLICSIIAARVVDLPEPVVPVTNTSPRFSAAIDSTTFGSRSWSTVLTPKGMTRKTQPIVPRCWKTFTRKRPRPGIP
jgi:Tfp pilus assembly pilus retraction ATPase PilT